jgi:hypothetical protein
VIKAEEQAPHGACFICKAQNAGIIDTINPTGTVLDNKGIKRVTMKKIFGFAVIALLGLSAPSFAQSKVDKTEHAVKHGAKEAWHGTKKGAKAVGNKTAEVASKGEARIADKKSDVWVGPEGQTIYLDDAGKYYWINGKGKRIYVSESALKAKAKH